MPFSVAMIGAGQFSGSFAHLFHLHPGVSTGVCRGRHPGRADELVGRWDSPAPLPRSTRPGPAPTSMRSRS